MTRIIRRLKEKLLEKAAELEDAKDSLIDLQHSKRTQEIVMLASPTHAPRPSEETPAALNLFAHRREGLLVGQVANMKNALTRATADNVFLANVVKVAVREQGELPDAMYTEAMRICQRFAEEHRHGSMETSTSPVRKLTKGSSQVKRTGGPKRTQPLWN